EVGLRGRRREIRARHRADKFVDGQKHPIENSVEIYLCGGGFGVRRTDLSPPRKYDGETASRMRRRDALHYKREVMKRDHPKVAPLVRTGLGSARYPAAGNCAGCGASAAAALAAASFSRSSRMSASRLPATSRSPFIMAPVPAGISRPTMTFSLRPSSVSILPLTAA